MPMTARRLRESPRLIAAGLVTAALLILVGVLIGAATAGSGDPSKSTAPAPRTARQRAQLLQARQTIVSLRTQLSDSVQRTSGLRSQLATTRARARCWRAAALHRTSGRVANCAGQT
ncbi:MAG TPA: hypothetical protein VMD09_15030 [Solirubrobacteraceae bacterium]|nr:hypothetical protein [Solirubrobacteraceae bacterium]